MIDEEKKAIENIKNDMKLLYGQHSMVSNEDLETLLQLLEKQEKVIDEMAGYLAIIRDCPNEDKGANLDCENRCNNTDEIYEECWKQYFYRKVEEDE